MDELYLTRKLIKEIRAAKAGIVFNHTHAIAAGIPDLSVINGFGTLWIEVKAVAEPIDLGGKQFREGQLAALCALEYACNESVVYVVFVLMRRSRSLRIDSPLFVIRPSEVRLRRRSVLLDEGSFGLSRVSAKRKPGEREHKGAFVKEQLKLDYLPLATLVQHIKGGTVHAISH